MSSLLREGLNDGLRHLCLCFRGRKGAMAGDMGPIMSEGRHLQEVIEVAKSSFTHSIYQTPFSPIKKNRGKHTLQKCTF